MLDLVSFLPRAVMQGIPLLYGSTGEILTEKSGNLNLGIPGIMYVGGICGVIGAFFYEQSTPAEAMSGLLAIGIPLFCSLLGSLLMGLLYCLLTVTRRKVIYHLYKLPQVTTRVLPLKKTLLCVRSAVRAAWTPPPT